LQQQVEDERYIDVGDFTAADGCLSYGALLAALSACKLRCVDAVHPPHPKPDERFFAPTQFWQLANGLPDSRASLQFTSRWVGRCKRNGHR